MSTQPDLFSQPPMEVARKKRDAILVTVQVSAGAEFGRKARAFIIEFLQGRPDNMAPGEDITDACKAAGIKPPKDDRSYGPVFMALMRDEIIMKAGSVQRRKGHATSGGNVWRLKMPWK